MTQSRKRIVIIGIDGVSWQLLNPFIERDHMPNLKMLRDGGCHGILRSTDPPITPAAWTTMMTGVHPGKHGVFGFTRYDMDTNRAHFTNSRDITFETMWSYLSRHGYKVASINVPQTYPPFPVNGVVVSGFGCPGKEFNYTYPEQLKEKIENSVPDYDMTINWRKDNQDQDHVFAENIAYCKKAFTSIWDLTRMINDQDRWELMMVQFHQTDTLQHYIYHLLTPQGWEKNPDRAELVFQLFRHLDDIIGKIAAFADGPNDLVIVASDHGLTPLKATVSPNCMLKEWGFLRQHDSFLSTCGARLRRRKEYLERRFIQLFNRKTPVKRSSKSTIDKLRIDWSHTRAIVVHISQHAFVHLNVKGRQPSGIVSPGTEYEQFVEQLRELFLSVRNPHNGENIFVSAQTAQQMYGLAKEDAYRAGDLILVPADGYLPVGSMKKDGFIKTSGNEYQASHQFDGMYLLSGPNVKRGLYLNAKIVDIAPTVYAALGAPLPQNLDGKPLESAFQRLSYTSSAKSSTPFKPQLKFAARSTDSDQLTSQEEDMIKKRLEHLGYLE